MCFFKAAQLLNRLIATVPTFVYCLLWGVERSSRRRGTNAEHANSFHYVNYISKDLLLFPFVSFCDSGSVAALLAGLKLTSKGAKGETAPFGRDFCTTAHLHTDGGIILQLEKVI